MHALAGSAVFFRRAMFVFVPFRTMLHLVVHRACHLFCDPAYLYKNKQNGDYR